MTHWMIDTQGNPLRAFQQFIHGLYITAELDGLLIPLETDGQTEPRLIDSEEMFSLVNPFFPLMNFNSATKALDMLKRRPDMRLGLVLRACEVRALLHITERENVDISRILLVGVDCVGTLPVEAFDYVESVNAYTQETLHYARQGGVAPFRYRNACQMCAEPFHADVDISVDIFGLPTSTHLMVTIHDDDLIVPLNISQLTEDVAPAWLVDQHERVKSQMAKRRQQARARSYDRLSSEFVMQIDNLIDHLESCEPCRECLNVCPIYTSEAQIGSGRLSRETVTRWVSACAGCGMCEQSCPDHLPLASILGRLKDDIAAAMDIEVLER